jgi:hypothetical protein
VYGLSLRSTHVLPGLVATAGDGPSDVQLDLIEGPAAQLPDVAAVEWRAPPLVQSEDESSHGIWRGDGAEGTFLRLRYGSDVYRRAVEFVIDPPGNRVWAGRQVWGGAGAPTCLQDVTTLLLGAVLGCVLRLRGTLCLHASVVGIEGRGIVILGSKGAGKSTLAAALAGSGHPVLSDDVAAITSVGGTWLVQPGYPRLRLWPTALGALQRPVARSTPILSLCDKRYVELADDGGERDTTPWRFQSTPLPLSTIYLTTRDARLDTPVVDRVPDATRLAALIRYTYVSFLPQSREGMAREFRRLFRLAATVPVHRIRCPEGLRHLPAICEALAGHARTVGRDGR